MAKKKEACETCPIEETYEAMAVEDKLYLNWQTVAGSIRRRIGQGNSERRLLRVLRRCGAMDRGELLTAAATRTGDSEAALSSLLAQGLVRGEREISLTEAGEAAATEAAEQQITERRSYFSDLSSEEKEALLKMLEKLNNGWLGK